MTTPIYPVITDDVLAELEEAAKAATPGPWGWDGPVWAYDPAKEAPWLIVEATGDPIVHGEIECNERNALFLSLSHPATVLALIARIRELEARQWVPVTERIPEPGVAVMVYATQGGMLPFFRIDRDGEWCSDSYLWGGRVTHWMPLPDPPKEDA